MTGSRMNCVERGQHSICAMSCSGVEAMGGVGVGGHRWKLAREKRQVLFVFVLFYNF